jgi:hypothetical protein
MPRTYIPNPDAEFGPWLLNLAVLATASPATYGLTAPQAVVITAQSDLWIPAYTAATDPSTRTPASIANKDAVRAAATATVRPLCVSVSLNPAVTDEDKVALGVTVRKTTPTPVPPPSTRPGLNILGNTPGVVNVSYVDVDLPVGKSKPPGATGIQIWQTVGTEYATDPQQASLAAIWTKSPNKLFFASEQSGKRLSLWARWQTTSGPAGQAQVGPWSDRLTTIIV